MQELVNRDGSALEDFDEMAERYARDLRSCDSTRARRLRDDMIRASMPMAERLARRYRGGSEPIADLEQVARLGLVKAVDRYDPGRGSFTAYAIHTVQGELKRHLRDHAWGVHVPRRMREMAVLLARLDAELTRELGRRPSEAEVAAKAGLSAEDLDRVRVSAAGFRPLSLDAPIGADEAQFADFLGGPDSALERTADRLTVADLIACLPDRERHVVITTFYGGRPQVEVAAELGVSQMQVSRILSRALSWMREGLLTDRVPRWPAREDAEEAGFGVRARLLPSRDLEVAVSGEVDRDNAARLRTALLDLIRRQPAGRRVTLQLSGVPLLDAAGIRVLLAVYEAAQARRVVVTATGLQPAVRRIAATSGLGPMLG